MYMTQENSLEGENLDKEIKEKNVWFVEESLLLLQCTKDWFESKILKWVHWN